MRQATVGLRPELPGDRSFLVDLYLSTRDGEVGYRDLDPGKRSRLLEQQFDFQYQQYRRGYPQAWFTIVEVDGRPAGRLYVAQMTDCLRIIDVSLLPEYRGFGIGSNLIKNVLAESMRTGLPVRLSVVNADATAGFYARLGFRISTRGEIRSEMEWQPEQRGLSL